MKKLLLLSLFSLPAFHQTMAQHPATPFLGRWALYLPGGAGWLDVKLANNTLDADLFLFGGGVEPCANAYLDGETLVVTRLRKFIIAREGDKIIREQTSTELNRFTLSGEELRGKQIRPLKDGTSTTMQFIGKKISDLPPPPDLSKIAFGKPLKIFNGKNLEGWKLVNENHTNGWNVLSGELVNNPVQTEGKPHIPYGNLRTIEEFEDFNLKIQVNVPAGSNSGIYLRGIYEVQVSDSYNQPLSSLNMGAIYSRLTPTVAAEKPADSWQDLDITLCDRHVTIILNGKKIIDNQPLYGCTGGALTPDESKPGPIYLQGDHGKVSYRNLLLTPIIKK